MILPSIFNWWDRSRMDAMLYIFFHFFLLFLVVSTISHAVESFGLTYFFILLILLTEVIYHLEPRSKKDKKNGRDYFMVFFKKLDSAFDGVMAIGVVTAIHKIGIMIRVEHITYGLKVIGFIVGVVILAWIYLWLNRLRDRPKKKKVRNIKNKRTGGKK